MAVKISVLGAGSSVFSMNFIKDLCLTKSLYGSEICFMDISEERLNNSYGLCTRLASEMGADFKITKTTDRAESMKDSSFVVDTILIGGYDNWTEGWDIAEKWGYRRGGSLHIMHDEAFWSNFYQLRMMESVAQDMRKNCPKAWLLMVSNPVMAGTTYLRRHYPDVKMVGLCHGTSMVRFIAKYLGMDMKDVVYEIPGINHYVFMNHFYYKGENAFPVLDKWIEDESEEFFKTCSTSGFLGPKVVDIYKRYGVLPVGDTASPGGGSWGYEYHSDREVEKSWKEDPKQWFEDYLVRNRKRVEKISSVINDESKSVSELTGTEMSTEPMVPIIESVTTGIEHKVVVNVLNDRNYVPGYPLDFAVEVPAVCGKFGIHPVATDPLPKAVVMRGIHDRVVPVELELLAYENHSRSGLLDLVMTDPRSHSMSQAEGLVDEILSLPRHMEMREWYK